MKRIKIFLASSIEDLREDRLQIGDFFRQLNDIYMDSGIYFSLIKCEDYDNAISSGGKQQEYDREIRESELVFFLFFRKVGDYTKHEFEVALEAFKNQKKPKIVTYFKYINTIDEAKQEVRDFMQMLDQEMKHYYNTYGNIDTLKLGILMQIKLMQLDSSQVQLKNGEVLLNNLPMVKAENVPLLRGNQTLRELTEKRRQLQAELTRCRKEFLADDTPENEAAFFDASAELNRVSKQLEEVEQATMVLLTNVAEMTSAGRVLTHRLKEALKYFNHGDYAAVEAILRDEERENELRRAELRAKVAKNEIQGYVEEELLSIKTAKAQGITEDRVQKILKSYQKIMELVEKHDLDKAVLYDYACFLYNQNRFAEAVSVAEKLNWYYDNPSIRVKEKQKVDLYNLLGVLYKDIQRYTNAEEAFRKALEMATRNPDAFEPALADSYNNLGNLYSDTQRYIDAEVAYQRALEIRSRLVAHNPDAFEAVLADSYHNLGVLYIEIQRYTDAEVAYGKVLEIYTRLATRNPDAFEPALARGYNNIGVLYKDIQRYTDAEAAYQKALEIYIRLATRNPDAFEPGLARGYNNLGVLYMEIQRYTDAEVAYGKALEIYTRLATRNPNAFEPALADSYNNLGVLFNNTQQYAEAEAAYQKALEIRTRLAQRNPDAFAPALALSYNNLGVLYRNTQRYVEAEDAHSKAVESYTRLVARNPDAFEPSLAYSYNSLGILHGKTQRHVEAEAAYQKALEIKTRLAQCNPDVHEPDLATSYTNLGILYRSAQRNEEAEEAFSKAAEIRSRLAARKTQVVDQFNFF